MKEHKDNPMKTILIIDDDNRNIFALKAVLASRGLQSVTANSAIDGLRLLESDPAIKLVLLDMMMPGMDGYQAISQIRNGPRGTVPVVAVTAQAMMGDRDKCLRAGANAYLSKPIDVDHLMILVQQFLDQDVIAKKE